MTDDVLTLLAATEKLEDNDVSPGVLGFVVVALLGVATWLLIRSMTKRIRHIEVPKDDDRRDKPQDEAP